MLYMGYNQSIHNSIRPSRGEGHRSTSWCQATPPQIASSSMAVACLAKTLLFFWEFSSSLHSLFGGSNRKQTRSLVSALALAVMRFEKATRRVRRDLVESLGTNAQGNCGYGQRPVSIKLLFSKPRQESVKSDLLENQS